MTSLTICLLASFTTPMRVGTDPASMLWLLPLTAAIAIVYKATKVARIQSWPFVRETAGLFGSIIVFIVVAAVILYALAWIVTGELPALLNSSAF
ncbi:MAG: hypothetical protein ABFE01_04140 [Phycisphaerales bacterium]|jgi:hypothetical protein